MSVPAAPSRGAPTKGKGAGWRQGWEGWGSGLMRSGGRSMSCAIGNGAATSTRQLSPQASECKIANFIRSRSMVLLNSFGVALF